MHSHYVGDCSTTPSGRFAIVWPTHVRGMSGIFIVSVCLSERPAPNRFKMAVDSPLEVERKFSCLAPGPRLEQQTTMFSDPSLHQAIDPRRVPDSQWFKFVNAILCVK